MRKVYLTVAISVLCLFTAILGTGLVEASSLPPWPTIYSGDITVAGAIPADGAVVTAKIGDYTSQPVAVKNGRYAGLAVGAPNSNYFGKTITFHLDDMVVAAEADIFNLNTWIVVNSSFDLTFPAYPTPTPTPTAVPTATPTATPVPSPTPTPEIPSAMIITGVVDVENGQPSQLEGATIVARVGSYFSEPATLILSSAASRMFLEFEDLIIDPRDYKYAGGAIAFFVDGLKASSNPTIYESAGRLDLAISVSLPDAAVIPAEIVPTAVPPAPVPTVAVPTAPPTAAPTAFPTATPTSAPVPTQVMPTASPVVLVVTATPSGEVEPVESAGGGGCNAPTDVSGATGAANTLMLVSPLMFIGAYKGLRRRNKSDRDPS